MHINADELPVLNWRCQGVVCQPVLGSPWGNTAQIVGKLLGSLMAKMKAMDHLSGFPPVLEK